MLSPFWLFGIPAGVCVAFAAALLMTMSVASLAGVEITRFGNYWAVLAGSLLTLGHMGMILALAGQLYGIRETLSPRPRLARAAGRLVHPGSHAARRLGFDAGGLSVLTAVLAHWTAHNLQPIASVFPAVLGTCALAIGMQNVLGGFLLAIVSGNSAEFLQTQRSARQRPRLSIIAQPTEVAAGQPGHS